MRFDENPLKCQCLKEDKKAYTFQISLFYWLFLSDIMAVKGLINQQFVSAYWGDDLGVVWTLMFSRAFVQQDIQQNLPALFRWLWSICWRWEESDKKMFLKCCYFSHFEFKYPEQLSLVILWTTNCSECMCIFHIIMLEPLLMSIHYVLAFVKLLIKFSISSYIVC